MPIVTENGINQRNLCKRRGAQQCAFSTIFNCFRWVEAQSVVNWLQLLEKELIH